MCTYSDVQEVLTVFKILRNAYQDVIYDQNIISYIAQLRFCMWAIGYVISIMNYATVHNDIILFCSFILFIFSLLVVES